MLLKKGAIQKSGQLEGKESKTKEFLLREGYEAMALESKKIMEDFKHVDKEALKYSA